MKKKQYTPPSDFIHEAFSFLVDEFAFEELKRLKSERETVWYRRDACGVKVHWETRANALWVDIFKLVDGRFVANEGPIDDNWEMRCVQVDHIFPEGALATMESNEARYTGDEVGLRNYMFDFGELVKKYTSHFLRGDFTDWPRITKLIIDYNKRAIEEDRLLIEQATAEREAKQKKREMKGKTGAHE